MVISRYNATLPLLSPVAAAKNRVLARATAIAESTAKLATVGHVRAVRPDLSAPSAVAARCTIEYIREPISAAARVTPGRSAPGCSARCRSVPGSESISGSVKKLRRSESSGGRYRLPLPDWSPRSRAASRR